MSENPTDQDRSPEDDPDRQAERERAVHDGEGDDVRTVPAEEQKDAPDDKGEDRFDAG